MQFRKTPIAIAALTVCGAIPLQAQAAPTIAFTAPAVGGALKGDVKGPPNCIVEGSDITRVMFYLNGEWTNTDGNLANGLGCWIDTTKHKDGAYTLKAVAYNAAGQTATTTRDIVIQNTAPAPTPTPTGGAPTVSFTAPAIGGTLKGDVKGPPNCIVEGNNIARVMFYLNGVWTNTDGNLDNGLGCWIDTTKHKDGAYTLKAVAYNAAGQTATTTRDIVIQNTVATPTPTPTEGTPTVSFTAPAIGGALKGDVKGPPNCIVEGSNIARVMFYLNDVWTNTDGNLDNGLGCWIDTTKYKDGAYTLKAVAYNAAGQTATTTRDIVIQNTVVTPTPTPAPSDGTPTISFTAPAVGGVLKGNVQGPPNCIVEGSNIARVMFYINDVWTNTDGNLDNGLGCWIDTTKYADGPYTVKAVAYNAAGDTASVTRDVVIKNGTTDTTPTPAPTPSSIPAADIIGQAREDMLFSEQNGYNTQVINKYVSAPSIPESGIHGTTLPNGETLRLGKAADPANSSRKALAFQLHPNDPDTSGSKRSEISFGKNIEPNKVYWVALRTYVPDWGTLASNDVSIFGTQLHSGDNSRGLSPTFSLVANSDGRSFQVYTLYSTSSSPSQGNTTTIKYAKTPIPFGKWTDFVIKFKENTSGAGFLQVWMDGKQIVDHKGNLGFNTPGYNDYMKFGYYNWSGGFNSTRKVLLRKPTIVLDPTGSKYSVEALRAHINQ
jgi:hypothetical protein